MAVATISKINIRTNQTSSLEKLVGNTPLIPLHRIFNNLSPNVKILAKAEWYNPSGSVKDRAARQIIETAIQEGKLTPEKRLLDSTSGNMGIAYATIAASKGIQVTLTMPSNASPERIAILRALGAELILTDPLEGSDGAMHAARQLAQSHPTRYYYANQYDNPANWQAHYQTTGPEVLTQTQGQITHFVAGMGTSGTLTGVGRYLRLHNPQIQIIGVQPDSPFHGLEGLKHFESSVRPKIFDPSLVNQIIEVQTEEVYQMVRDLAQKEGLFVGISSGAAALAAYQAAKTLEQGVVVTIFPDAGYKYLSDESLWGEQQPNA